MKKIKKFCMKRLKTDMGSQFYRLILPVSVNNTINKFSK